MKPETLERKIDALYREPLEAFVAARAAVTRLERPTKKPRKSGKR